jgi:hypothetical protein
METAFCVTYFSVLMPTLLMLIPSCTSRNSESIAEGVSLPVWGRTHTLTDGYVAIQVSPDLGRVMSVSQIGKPNLLWQNPAPKSPEETPWPNYGGDKQWPWPQNVVWSWPPPRAIDPGPYQVVELTSNHCRMIGSVDANSGLQASREISIERGTVHNVYTLTRKALSTRPSSSVACWAITQVPSAREYYVRLRAPKGNVLANQLGGESIEVKQVSPRWVKILQPLANGKVGLDGDALAVKSGDQVLLIELAQGKDLDTKKIDDTAQIYFYLPKVQPDPRIEYVELELVGRNRKLEVGDSVELRTQWRMLTDKEFFETMNK